LGQQRSEQTACHRETDAFGLSGTGKGSEPVGIDNDSVLQLGLELADLPPESLHLVTQLLQVGSAVVLLECLQDAAAVAVKSLAGESMLASAPSDVAVRPGEDSSSVGDSDGSR